MENKQPETPQSSTIDPQFFNKQLTEQLTGRSRLAIAFSGGVDSTLLAYAAASALGRERILLLLADSVLTPRREAAWAVEWAAANALPLEVVPFAPLEDPAIVANRRDRCYHCKKRLLNALRERAALRGFTELADGTNADDPGDDRPGLRACAELGVIHPLLEARLDKAAVRSLARFHGLPNWNLPAAACLASRIATDQPLAASALERVERAEEYLRQRGFSGPRARWKGRECRLELRREEDYRLLLRERREIAAALRRIGADKVLLDLDGYPAKKRPDFTAGTGMENR